MRTLLTLVLACAVLAPVTASAAALDRIKQNGSIKLGYRVDAAPYSYRNSIGEAAGYSVDLCRAVVVSLKRQLKLDEVKIEFVEVTTEGRFDAVADGKIDLLCGATTATLSRREAVDFSLTTFIDGAGVMFREDGPGSFKELAGQKVGVRGGTTTETALRNTLKKIGIEAELVSVSDHNDGLSKLEEGKLAAYFADRAILVYLLSGRQLAGKLHVSPDYFSQEPYALALARGDDDFRLAVDRALSRIFRGKTIVKIFRNAFGNVPPSDTVQALYVINSLPE
jgi:polar amino acid transport system substrate-binding protein/glutamate/aspartate transport system substrate-binding protein